MRRKMRIRRKGRLQLSGWTILMLLVVAYIFIPSFQTFINGMFDATTITDNNQPEEEKLEMTDSYESETESEHKAPKEEPQMDREPTNDESVIKIVFFVIIAAIVGIIGYLFYKKKKGEDDEKSRKGVQKTQSRNKDNRRKKSKL